MNLNVRQLKEALLKLGPEFDEVEISLVEDGLEVYDTGNQYKVTDLEVSSNRSTVRRHLNSKRKVFIRFD